MKQNVKDAARFDFLGRWLGAVVVLPGFVAAAAAGSCRVVGRQGVVRDEQDVHLPGRNFGQNLVPVRPVVGSQFQDAGSDVLLDLVPPVPHHRDGAHDDGAPVRPAATVSPVAGSRGRGSSRRLDHAGRKVRPRDGLVLDAFGDAIDEGLFVASGLELCCLESLLQDLASGRLDSGQRWNRQDGIIWIRFHFFRHLFGGAILDTRFGLQQDQAQGLQGLSQAHGIAENAASDRLRWFFLGGPCDFAQVHSDTLFLDFAKEGSRLGIAFLLDQVPNALDLIVEQFEVTFERIGHFQFGQVLQLRLELLFEHVVLQMKM